ncbi:MAG: FlgD immunoglobulin-like domain containing protein [bacterium]
MFYCFIVKWSGSGGEAGQPSSNTTIKQYNHKTSSGALRALRFITSARAYPEPTIPDAGIAPAFDFSKTKAAAARLQTAQVELEAWHPIGPHNIGGRTLAIALNPQNPNTVYAGSASGGLWRSTTGGVGAGAWHRVTTGFPVLGVSAIAIAPDDSNTIYIGTGEVYGSEETHPGITGERLTRGSYGIGILKTSDGGQTWRKSLDWLVNQKRGVQMVRINPLRSATVWAATTEGTFKSVDAGVSWQKVHDVVMATDIAVNPQDTTVVFVACGGMRSAGHGLYRTQDSGQTWQQMVIPGVPSFNGKARLSISLSSPEIVYASIGFSNGSVFNRATGTWVVKTSDGGDTWSVVSTLDYSSIQGWYAHDVVVDPTNPDIVWAAGQPFTPVRSTDGGHNLAFVSGEGLFRPHPETVALGLTSSWADFHNIVFHPTNPEIIYFANDGGVFRSEDGGRTVRNLNRGYQTTQFYNGVSSSDTDSLFTVGGMQDNNSAAYEGSESWRRLFGGDGAWTAINQSNNDVIYVSLQWLQISMSLNRGRNNSFIDITPPRDLMQTNFIAPFVLSPVDNQTLYAGSNRVHKSTNGGVTWRDTNGGQPLDANPLIALGCSHQDVDVVYGATSPGESRGNLFKTTTGGETWVTITGDLPDRFPTDLAVDPNNDRTVLVTFGGFGLSHLFRTDDGGATWQDIGAGLPDAPAWAVTIDPDFPQQIFVGTDIGVYFSPDGGRTWQVHMQGLPDAVFAMDLSISRSNRVLRVATHGNGFYESRLPQPEATLVTEAGPVIPETVALEQNYPNPFNLETRIPYFLEQDQQVDLVIYNALGQQVRRLVSGRQTKGWHQAFWDGTDNRGEGISSGLYLYQLMTQGSRISRKMVVLK